MVAPTILLLVLAAGGKLMDVLGTRLGFTLIMVFWSLACAGHGLASTLVSLAAMRVVPSLLT